MNGLERSFILTLHRVFSLPSKYDISIFSHKFTENTQSKDGTRPTLSEMQLIYILPCYNERMYRMAISCLWNPFPLVIWKLWHAVHGISFYCLNFFFSINDFMLIEWNSYRITGRDHTLTTCRIVVPAPVVCYRLRISFITVHFSNIISTKEIISR